jgi:hypothetical protein
MRRIPCTPEDLWCQRPGNEQPEELAAHITPELVAAVGACGVGCKGDLAEVLRAQGHCGLHGPRPTFEDAADIVGRIIVGGEDPARLITDPPGILSPKSRVSEI